MTTNRNRIRFRLIRLIEGEAEGAAAIIALVILVLATLLASVGVQLLR